MGRLSMSRTKIWDEARRLQVGGLRRPMQGGIPVTIRGPGRSGLQALYMAYQQPSRTRDLRQDSPCWRNNDSSDMMLLDGIVKAQELFHDGN